MVDVLQSLDACIGITTCIIRIFEFAVNYRDARRVVEETRVTADNTRGVLEQIKDTLQTRPRYDGRRPDRRQVSGVLRSIENCNTTVGALIVYVWGRIVTDVNTLTIDTLQRARLALKPGDIFRLRSNLLLDFNALQLSLQALIV